MFSVGYKKRFAGRGSLGSRAGFSSQQLCFLSGGRPPVLFQQCNDITTCDVAVTALAMGTVGTIVAFCLLESYHNQNSIPHIGVLLIRTAYAYSTILRMSVMQ